MRLLPLFWKSGALLGLFFFATGEGWTQRPPPKPLPIKLTAKINNRFNWDTQKDNLFEEKSKTTTDINAQVKYLPNPTVQAVAGQWMVDGKVRPYNIYLNLASEHINLRLGNQIVRWGKADEISPLDILNPEDLTQGLTKTRADRKIPVPMANLEFLTDYLNLQGIFIPFFEKSAFYYSGDDWSYFGHLEKNGPIGIQEKSPAQTLKDAGYGGRLSGTIGRIDLALVYLNHRRDTPSMAAFPIPPPPPGHEASVEDLVLWSKNTTVPLEFRYLREEVYGLEFETTMGSFGLRGDASYVSSHSFITSTLEEKRKPLITAVGGFDYNGPSNSYMNLSYSQSHIRDFETSLAPHKQKTSSLSGQCSVEILSGNIKLGYLGFVNLTDKSFYHNPKINVGYIPNVGIELGVDIYGGPPSSQIGFFDNNDQTYLSLTYFF